MMKLFQWRYGLLLWPFTLWLPSNAQALTCQVDSFISPHLGTITLANANNASVEQTLTYSCTNTSNVTQWASVCIGADGGTNNTSQINPRHMIGRNGSKLNFNMTLNGMSNATWGNRIVGGTEFIDFFSVAPDTTTPTIKETIIRVSLLPNNNAAKADDYTATFIGSNAALTYVTVDSSNDTSRCLSETQGTSPFSFTVQAAVVNECKITTQPTDINLGNVSANSLNIDGSSSIGVTCTNAAPHTIGLTTFNAAVNNDGRSFMKGTGNNTNKIPYQLLRDSEGGRVAWGNGEGNWAVDVGTGEAKTKNIYVTVPSADFKPDTYSDTVTVHVNY
ncbi:Spore coat U [Psychrobacter aquaticus CMS 56]|uniref:Spore coat U n=2 Tax=Psychrobacter TaxID=497 RepID=U4T4N3_9GAMM|nr:Spore coat U [Psychrobacter aquaticus CMS 56]